MKFSIPLILFVLIFSACSSQPKNAGMSITTASTGLMKNQLAPFPIYLTDKMESRVELSKKYSDDLFIIHTGHVLKADMNKEANEKQLLELAQMGHDLVNLTLEDFTIADTQGINFENFPTISFLNSSVIDLTADSLAGAKNILPSTVHGGVAFIGLSDSQLDKKLPKEKFIISDYVLSILKVKKEALKSAPAEALNSFIIVHTLGGEINDVMLRLPPSFINSLAD